MELGEIYKSVLENMREAVYVRDLHMNLLYVNPASERLTGWSMDEAVGKKCYEVFGDENHTCREVCPVNKAISAKHPIIHNEGRLKTRSGEIKKMRVSISPLYEGRRVTGGVVVMEDITSLKAVEKTNAKTLIRLEKEIKDRKQAEALARQSNKFLQDIFDGIQDGISVLDPDLTITQVNAWIEKSHVRDMPLVGRKCYEVYQQRETPCPWCPSLRSLETGEAHVEEVHVPMGDGSFYWAELSAYPIKDEAGNVIGIIEHAKDISLRKQSEEKLRESEKKYRALFENAVEGIFQTTLDGRYLSANSYLAHLFGYNSPQDLMKSVTNIGRQHYVSPQRREIFKKTLETVGSITDFEVECVTKTGSTIWVSLNARAVKDDKGSVRYLEGTITDITERKQMEDALRESEDKFRSLVEQAAEMLFLHDLKGNIIEINLAAVETTGYSREAHEKMTVFDIDPDAHDRNDMRKHWEALKPENPPVTFEARHQRKDGSVYPVEVTGSKVVLQDGVYILGLARDITERKQSEKALRKSETRFRELFNSISDLVYTQDLDGRLLSMNPALCKTFGYDEKELLGRQVSDFMKPEFAKAFESEYLDKVKKEGYHEGTTAYLTKEDNQIYLEYRSAMVYPEVGEPYITGIARDVTARLQSERENRKLQAQLNQAQKMESIGILAGGIAHNFNNILMAIQGRASLMMMEKDPSNPDYEHLRGIESYVKNAVLLTRDLLGFARGGKYEVKSTDLNALIQHENRMFGRTKKEIQIREEYEEDLWTVEVDQGQIQQVLLNLYVNASHAMPAGGDLYIRTENVTLDEKDRKTFEIAPGKYVKISVTDSGVGMDAATRKKIFDPFFTTRDAGQGSGLGLSSVYGIIKNHGGFINVYSEKGVGTTFTIYLPVSEKETTEEAPRSDQAKTQYGRGTVLLVDDEEMVIEVGQEVLEKLGYHVMIAGSGREALHLYEKHREGIDLVILDMIMPGMGGGKTFEGLKGIDGDVKVILSSGYSINGQAQEILDSGCIGFIQKPFSLKDLSIKVRKALDEVP